MADYTLSAKITGDSSDFEKAFSTAQKTVDTFESRMEATSSKFQKIGGDLMTAGAVMTAGITAPIVMAGKNMVSAASDYEENLNKIDVAFGESSKVVKDWAENATKQFGLSKNQALEATSLFGDMATSMGLTQPAAADMSTSLAGLAGDLASFKNISTDQAMTALNGVFTGETESLKTLGIMMTDTELNAYALEKGFGKTTAQMTQAEKVSLRYAYVMDMAKNAQGDYGRTSDGTANSMRDFSGAVDNLNIVLGQKLLPILTPLIQKATGLIDKFAEADPNVQNFILTAAGLLAIIGPILLILGAFAGSIGNIIGLFAKGPAIAAGFGKAIGFLSSPIGIAIMAIGAVIAIGILLATHWEEVKAIASAVWTWIQQKLQQFSDFVTGIFSKDWSESFGGFGDILNGFLKTVTNIWDSIKRIFSGIVDFVAGIFTGNWERAWDGVMNIFGGIWDGLGAIVKAPLNGMISIVNAAIGGLNQISVDVPSWVPKFGGKKFGFDIPKIPYLLHGTNDWSGGFARMNEGGRGELAYLPDGTQVIPHDISVQYAKESARMSSSVEPVDLSGIMEGMVVQIMNNVTVDGAPLREMVSDYTIEKIGNQQRARLRARGAY